MKIERAFPLFAAAFAVIYVIAVEYNLALVTYHPKLKEWGFLTEQPKAGGPAMYWYGWILTATLGAGVVSLAALPILPRLKSFVWIGWVIPLLVMASFLYFLRTFFLH